MLVCKECGREPGGQGLRIGAEGFRKGTSRPRPDSHVTVPQCHSTPGARTARFLSENGCEGLFKASSRLPVA